jgi:hypothetical protein
MSLSQRAVIAPLVTVATVAALVFGTGALSASADPVAPTVASGAIDNPLLTLPLTDGFNDASTLTITTSSASDITLNSTGVFDGDVVTPVLDSANANYTATVDLASLDPAAGDYELDFTQDATPFTGPVLTVGSGQATTVTVEPAASPFLLDSPVPTTLATVTAQDETNTPLPITAGTWTLTQGAKTATGNVPSSGIISTPALRGFAAGSAVLAVTGVAGPDGSVTKSADPTDITLATTLRGVGLSRSLSTVFPTRDGYRDTVSFKVVPEARTSPAPAFTGSIVIRKGTKVVKSFAIHGTVSSTVVWNGREGTRIVPGIYSVTATLTSLGTTVHAQTSVAVSKAKLHLRKQTVTVAANSFFAASHNIDSSTPSVNKFANSLTIKSHTMGSPGGSCGLHGKSLYCSSTADGDSFRFGYASVPRGVLRSTALRPYALHLSIRVTEQTHSKTSGPLYDWISDSRGEIGGALITKTGYKVTPTAHFSGADGLQGVLIETINSSSVHISSVRMSYSYYTLS